MLRVIRELVVQHEYQQLAPGGLSLKSSLRFKGYPPTNSFSGGERREFILLSINKENRLGFTKHIGGLNLICRFLDNNQSILHPFAF